MKRLGIDFGTANTYLAIQNDDGSVAPLELTVGGQGAMGIASAVFYGENGETLIGNEAIQSYYAYTDEERQSGHLRLETNFKPDITRRPAARQAAVDFLKAVVRQAETARVDLPQDVVIGVPSEADGDFCAEVGAIAAEAGLRNVELMHEPFGALCFHLAHEDTPALVGQKTLVVDFGGGTCDFALVSEGRIRNSWGNVFLGGRLFDDLFYRWTLEQNPAVGTLPEECRFVLRTVDCRIAKESASTRWLLNDCWRKDPEARGRPVGVQPGIVLKDVTWSAFERRARHYVPSEDFLRQFGQSVMGRPGNRLRADAATDLIAWFRDALLEGLAATGLASGDVDTVILAGGSSTWPFVYDICDELFASRGIRVMRSSNVFAAIAEGLLRYGAIRRRSELSIRRIEAELPAFIEDTAVRVEREFSASYDVSSWVEGVFDAHVLPTLCALKQEGRACSVATLRDLLAERLPKDEAAAFMERIVRTREKRISGLVTDSFARWLAERGGVKEDGKIKMDEIKIAVPTLRLDIPFADFVTYGLSAALAIALFTFSVLPATQIAVLAALAAAWALGRSLNDIPLPACVFAVVNNKWTLGLMRRKFAKSFQKQFTDMMQGEFEKQKADITAQIEQGSRTAIRTLMPLLQFSRQST